MKRIWPRSMHHHLLHHLLHNLLLLLLVSFYGCLPGGEEGVTDLAMTECLSIPAEEMPASCKKVEVLFTDPGTREENGIDPEVEKKILRMIDRATVSVDFATMSFSHAPTAEAIVRAYRERGVKVRFVGDARHMISGNRGYEIFLENDIPMVSGNIDHLMHDKFLVIDGRFVILSSANYSNSSFFRDANHFLFIDSPGVAADFTAEFEQMFSGRFSSAKVPIDNGNRYVVGDTIVEVYFSPQENPMGRILEEIEEASESVHFFIFAFTKDQVGSAFIRKFEEGLDLRGVLDRSQLHGNGPYHEVYRMAMRGMPLRRDVMENSVKPGDYQFSGGRLHHKTMVLDGHDPERARVLTGSFNWSSTATMANDEFMVVLRGKRISDIFEERFERYWFDALPLDGDNLDTYNGEPDRDDVIHEQSIVISEIHWDGWNGEPDPNDHTGAVREQSNDEFIELRNMTDRRIDISFWTISYGPDAVVGFSPGTYIEPNAFFFVVDHNLEPFSDTTPQQRTQAFLRPDYVLNLANDPRFPRLNIKNSGFVMMLRDNRGNVIDIAGGALDMERLAADGRNRDEMTLSELAPYAYATPPYYGGRGPCPPDFPGEAPKGCNYSMERAPEPGDGMERANWYQCEFDEGGVNVSDRFKFIITSPGESSRPLR